MSERKLEPAQGFEKVEYAVRAIRDFIMEGNLTAGTELPPESEMAKQIHVSKFSMREALRVLQAQGLIDITQGRRTRVADYSTKPAAQIMSLTFRRSKATLEELIEVRQELENRIARLCALRAGPDQIEAMDKTIKEMEKNKNDLDLCVRKDAEFHDILIRASKNKVLEIMYSPLADLLKESRKATLGVEGGLDRAISGHKVILSAIKDHEPVRAEHAMQDHLEMAHEDLKKANAVPRDASRESRLHLRG